MKISAMPAGAGGNPGTDLGNIHLGQTASAEKLAAAKAIAQGLEKPEAREETPAERAQSVRRITMRTNVSPDRYSQAATEQLGENTPEQEISTTLDTGGQTNAAAESTQPLSPQLAALAKQRRALQVKERELAEKEAKLATPPEGEYVSKADILSNPLKIFDLGLTYDQLTEAILQSQSGVTPELKSLKEELKRVKEDVNKTFTDRDSRQEEAVLTSRLDEAEALAKEGDDFEMIRTENAYDKVLNKIYTTYKKTGREPDLKTVMNEVESQLLEKNLRLANLNKIRSKIASEQVQPPQSQGKQMKTLTARDGAAIPMDRKARAIAAMNGTLRR